MVNEIRYSHKGGNPEYQTRNTISSLAKYQNFVKRIFKECRQNFSWNFFVRSAACESRVFTPLSRRRLFL